MKKPKTFVNVRSSSPPMKGGNIENIYAINMHMRCIIPDLLKKNILLEGSEKFENKHLEQYLKNYRLHNKDNGFHLQFLHKCHTLLENPYDFELLGKIKSMCMFTFKINKISKKYVCHVVYALSMYAHACLLGIRKRTVPNVARPASRRTAIAPSIIHIFWWLGHPSPHVEVLDHVSVVTTSPFTTLVEYTL